MITLNTLYEGTDALLRALGHDADALSASDTAKMQSVSQEIADIWNRIIGALPGWGDVIAGAEKPNTLREHYVFGTASVGRQSPKRLE